MSRATGLLLRVGYGRDARVRFVDERHLYEGWLSEWPEEGDVIDFGEHRRIVVDRKAQIDGNGNSRCLVVTEPA